MSVLGIWLLGCVHCLMQGCRQSGKSLAVKSSSHLYFNTRCSFAQHLFTAGIDVIALSYHVLVFAGAGSVPSTSLTHVSTTKMYRWCRQCCSDMGTDCCRAVQHAVMAGQMQAVSWLIAHGADIDQQDSAGNTALHFAAHSGQPAVVKELLASSASRTIKTKG